jgi:hypothetical protein
LPVVGANAPFAQTRPNTPQHVQTRPWPVMFLYYAVMFLRYISVTFRGVWGCSRVLGVLEVFGCVHSAHL